MKRRTLAIILSFATAALFMPLSVLRASEGEEMTVKNETGHTVTAYLFTDDHEHDGDTGGVQFATLENHASAVAHVPSCKFSIVLEDGEDVWHAEFHDCHSNLITFTATTGHGHHGGH